MGLSWDDLLAEAGRHTAESFDVHVLRDLVSRLEITPALLEGRIAFSEEAYARNLVHRDELFECVCLCWMDSQATSIHDHGRSFGVVRVVEGVMREEIFRVQDGAAPRGVKTLMHGPESLSVAPEGMIHRLGNGGEGDRRLVSLHFYAGPLDVMNLYDPGTGTVSSQSMRYRSEPDLVPG
ncbi:MAG: cysteine dioxygenase family protein [bacterium]|nr:cysteine dioxygenase family protein [bacterium]